MRRSALSVPLEEDECKWLMEWALVQRFHGIPLERLLIRVPNGAYHGRDRRAGAVIARKLREQGMKPGVFDYILPLPIIRVACFVPGLWLEMKRTRGGTVSDEQQSFMALMLNFGWRCEVARGWVEGSEIITKYLKEANHEPGS